MIERSHAQTISVDLVIEFYYMLMKVSDVKRLGVLGCAIRQDHMLGESRYICVCNTKCPYIEFYVH